METRYYVIEVDGGVAPFAQGPFETEDEQDDVAKEIHAKQNESDYLFWADVHESGLLTIGSYVAAFFSGESLTDES
jgi:hypothetical protein